MSFGIDGFIVTLYLIATLGVGIWKGVGTKSMKDFAVANSNYLSLTIIATIFATFIGGGATVGIIEKIHTGGIGFGIIFFGQVIQKFIIAKFIIPKMGKFNDCLSCGDLIEKVYGKESKFITGIVAVLVSIGMTAVQISAVGVVFQYFLELDFQTGVLLGGGIVVLYSAFGGMRSVIATDVFQFYILIVAFPIICNLGVSRIGGYENLIAQVPRDFVGLSFDKDFFKIILPAFIYFSIPFEALMAQRLLISKNLKQMRNSLLVSAFTEIPFIFIIIIIGLLGIALFPEIDSKLVLPHLVNDLLPTGFKGLAIAGILAVIMSTADSNLNTASVSVTNDLALMNLSAKSKLLLAKISTAVIGIMAIFTSLYYKNIIDIILLSASVWSSTVMIPLSLGIIGYKVTKQQFFITCILGFLSFLGWEIFADESLLSSYIVGLIVNVVIFFFFLYIKRNQDKSHSSSFLAKRLLVRLVQLKNKILSFNLFKYSANRVKDYGAQYITFGVFALINFCLPSFLWNAGVSQEYYVEISVIRIFSGFLAFLLLINHYWSKPLKPYLPFFWHFTLMFCFLFNSALMLLLHNTHLVLWFNLIISLLFLTILVDWLSFILLSVSGAILAILYFLVRFSTLPVIDTSVFGNSTVMEIIYLFIFAILIGSVFSRNREYIQNQVRSLLEEKVSERTIELTKALSAKKEFLNNISHEIRIPMQGILGISSGLKDDWEKLSEDKKKEYINIISKSSDRLMSLVSNLLDISKYDAKIFQLNKKRFDLAKTIKEEISSIVDRGIYFKFDQKNDYIVEADKIKISQVIRNLISNAIKYSDGDINISLKKKENESEFQISDKGAGIPVGEEENIFSPFTQGSHTKTGAGGVGLGLSICQSIIQAHRGKIWAKNNKSEGSSFYFTIPLENHKHKPKAKSKKNKILLIDDEDTILTSVSLMLSNLGFEVETVSGGIAALEYLMHHQDIDLVLLDLMMPDMYGLNVLEKLKKEKELKNIPVIIQTGSNDGEEINKAYSLGAEGCINKPCNKEDLKEAIQKAI